MGVLEGQWGEESEGEAESGVDGAFGCACWVGHDGLSAGKNGI